MKCNIKYVKNSMRISLAVITLILMFIPDTFFEIEIFPQKLINSFQLLNPNQSNDNSMWNAEAIKTGMNVALNKVLLLIVVFVITSIIVAIYYIFRKHLTIKNSNFEIIVKYGDIFNQKNSNKVIAFDECFTTKVGKEPGDVKEESICGQYITKKHINEQTINKLIKSANIEPMEKQSEYQNKNKYKSGTLLNNGEYLLMSFAKLNKDGLGYMKFEDYINCLLVLWKEIDKYSRMESVSISIFGSGITRFEDRTVSQQVLLDKIIKSYELSPYKLKPGKKLYIVCKKCDGFSLNNVCH